MVENLGFFICIKSTSRMYVFFFPLSLFFFFTSFETEETVSTILIRYYGESLNIKRFKWTRKKLFQTNKPSIIAEFSSLSFSPKPIVCWGEMRKKFCINFGDKNLWEKELRVINNERTCWKLYYQLFWKLLSLRSSQLLISFSSVLL